MRIILLLIVILMLSGCGASQENYQIATLPSGKQIKVIGIGKMYFSQDSPALMLKYQTDLSIDDKAALTREVNEIWKAFRVDVEKAQLTSAIISANEKPKGFILKESRSYNFGFNKSSDGQWSLQDKAK